MLRFKGDGFAVNLQPYFTEIRFEVDSCSLFLQFTEMEVSGALTSGSRPSVAPRGRAVRFATRSENYRRMAPIRQYDRRIILRNWNLRLCHSGGYLTKTKIYQTLCPN